MRFRRACTETLQNFSAVTAARSEAAGPHHPMAAGAPPPPWSEELDGIGLRHSKQLQDYCIALRHDDRGFCEDLLEHGTNRVVHSIVAASTVDWTDDFLRGALLAAGRETVYAALEQFRLHQSRVDLLTYGELQAVLDGVPVMQRRWPPTQTSSYRRV